MASVSTNQENATGGISNLEMQLLKSRIKREFNDQPKFDKEIDLQIDYKIEKGLGSDVIEIPIVDFDSEQYLTSIDVNGFKRCQI